jgi:hypothetical protein
MALLVVAIPLLSVIWSADVQVETALEVQVPRVFHDRCSRELQLALLLCHRQRVGGLQASLVYQRPVSWRRCM